jgi:pSer/pThr/pTyr-binding forkhead associated (FHA) protein
MTVKLKILHGKLQSKRGGSAGSDVEIRGPRFVIGSAADCSMQCPSSAVSPHHCELSVEAQGVVIRDLGSETGVWVNDDPVHEQRILETGDHLKIGRLEFEVLIDATDRVEQADLSADATADMDSVADDISNSLMDADEQDRAHRLQDPELRQFHLEEAAEEARKKKEATNAATPAEPEEGKKKGKPVMGKFTPPPPPPQPENTEDAAQEALRKLFGS